MYELGKPNRKATNYVTKLTILVASVESIKIATLKGKVGPHTILLMEEKRVGDKWKRVNLYW